MFKLSPQLQQSAQHVRGAILNAAGALAIVGLLVVPLTLAATTATNSCQLKSPKGAIQHVIYVQFDNTHFRRDNPDVPSDLEQMPHLLNFIQDNGVLMSNDHTVLISHTATGILTSLTGVYPDRMGQPVSNSFRYFKTDGTTRTGVSFAYWTAPLFDPAGSTTDTTPELTSRLYSAPAHPRRQRSCLILVKPLRILLALACIAPRAQPSVRRRTVGGQTYCPTSPAATVASMGSSVPSTSIPSSSQADR